MISHARRAVAAVAVAIVAVSLSACAGTTDGNPQTGGTGSGSAPSLTKKWVAKVGGGTGPSQLAGASADASRVYANDESGQVFGLDARTGKTLWSTKAGTRTGTTVGIAGGVVFYYDSNYKTSALDPRTGKLLWTRSNSDLTSLQVYHPAVSDGVVALQPYLTSNLQGVDARTGKVRWTLGGQTWNFSQPSTVTDGRYLYAIGRRYLKRDYLLLQIDPATGKVRWTVPAGAATRSQLYFGAGRIVIAAAGDRTEDPVTFTAIDPTTRAKQWQVALTDVSLGTSAPVLLGDTLIFASNDGLRGLSLTKGRLAFTSDVTAAQIGVCNTKFVCSPTIKKVQLVDSGGAKVGEFDEPDETDSIPDPIVDSAGRTYLTDSSNVYAYG